MKQVSEAMAAHLAGELTTLATCWKLKRRDNLLYGFTDHDSDIAYAGLIYQAETGFTPSAIESSNNLSVDNLDVEGMLTAGSISEQDILAGLYDFAEIEIFQLNYNDISMGEIKLRRGWLGEVSLHKQQFIAEVRGLTQRLSQTVGELFSPSCRAALGDSRCKVNLAAHTISAVVNAAENSQQFSAGLTTIAGEYNCGLLTFTSGANTGFSMEVKEQLYKTGTHFTLVLPMPYAVALGDTFTVSKGCDKTLSTCEDRFANVLNFRGEPFVPGIDKMLETAGTKSQW